LKAQFDIFINDRENRMKKKIPKFIYLFFSDYTLAGSTFAFLAFAVSGTASMFWIDFTTKRNIHCARDEYRI
jgi:hypothetical protein